jgi:cytidyltransferase-like protein
MNKKRVVIGGTFDHLHHGHHTHLHATFAHGDDVTIGLTMPELTQQKPLPQLIQSFNERKKYLEEYISQNWPEKTFSIVPITDIYGPSATEPSFELIVVTENLQENAEKVNAKRAENKLQPLEIISIPLITTEDGGALSSSRIRSGEIDRNGFVYSSLFTRDLRLPQSLRGALQEPFGQVMPGAEDDASRAALLVKDLIGSAKPTMIIAVGDVVSHSLKLAGVSPDISIIDYKTQRKTVENVEVFEKPHVANEAGTINTKATDIIAQAMKETPMKPASIIIDGEEDLLFLPVVMLAPLNSMVLYGQRTVGIVATVVTEDKKNYIRSLLEKFEK